MATQTKTKKPDPKPTKTAPAKPSAKPATKRAAASKSKSESEDLELRPPPFTPPPQDVAEEEPVPPPVKPAKLIDLPPRCCEHPASMHTTNSKGKIICLGWHCEVDHGYVKKEETNGKQTKTQQSG